MTNSQKSKCFTLLLKFKFSIALSRLEAEEEGIAQEGKLVGRLGILEEEGIVLEELGILVDH